MDGRPFRAARALGWVVCAAAFVSACTLGAPERTGEPCADAERHLGECLGEPPGGEFLADCDQSSAEEVLAMSCQEIEQGALDPKGDAFFSFLQEGACGAGLLRYCDVPACEAPRYPEGATSCSDYIGLSGCGACEYYACREARAENSCGENGYYLAHGYEYCHRLVQVAGPVMSPAGRAWLEDGRDCLMRFVEDHIAADEDCQSLRDRAYASHPDCYVDNGFCDLPVTDWLALFATIDTGDLDFVEIITTSAQCLDQYTDQIWALF